MVKALFDTNILIDHLNSVPAARAELGRYRDRAVSMITWIEVLVGAKPGVEAATRNFLDEHFHVIGLDEQMAERVVELRKLHRVKLPDAIIWACAQVHAMLLVTRNTKKLPCGDPSIRMPYRI
jgi:predicted nucleic acid-binding protein